MNIQEMKSKNLLLFESISGSQAYGLATEKSDTDIKGVFVLQKDIFYSFDYIDQINNETNDISYYELKKFLDLLLKNNPNILELLGTPDDCILFKHPLFEKFQVKDFLSKLCMNTFGNYAFSQIKRAKGLNKKIVNPYSKKRKTVTDFCYVQVDQGSVPIFEFLKANGLKEEFCGLSKILHMNNIYGLYYSKNENFKGIVQGDLSNEVSLSSIPKELKPMAIMSFNKDAYSKYCKDYKEYWDWVEKRNDTRYNETIDHGKNYDSKNMMHTFRLLNMAEEIGQTGIINVKRSADRNFLLNIKRGEFEYESLVKMAENKLKKIEEIFKNSSLPDEPDKEHINSLLINIREEFYKESSAPRV